MALELAFLLASDQAEDLEEGAAKTSGRSRQPKHVVASVTDVVKELWDEGSFPTASQIRDLTKSACKS